MANPQAATQQAPKAPATGATQGQSPSDAAARIKTIMEKPKAAASAGDDILSDAKPKAKKAPPKEFTKAKPQQAKKAPPKEADAGQAEDDAAEGLEAQADDAELDGTETDDAEAAEGDELEAADDADADEDNADEEGDDETHTVIVNGKEYAVSYEELISGYQRNADYTQKSQALASEKKALETERESVKDLTEQRKTYQEGAERFGKNALLVMAALETRFMPPEPDPSLAQSDPRAYHELKEKRAEALHFRGALQQELQSLEHTAKVHHQQLVKKSRAELYKVMPEMAEAPNRQKLREYANSLGFSDEQIAQEANHVLFVCVEKARRWDELQKRKETLKPKKPLPKAAKRTNAQPSARAVENRKRQDALAQHGQQKSVKSAETAIAGIFQRKGK